MDKNIKKLLMGFLFVAVGISCFYSIYSRIDINQHIEGLGFVFIFFILALNEFGDVLTEYIKRKKDGDIIYEDLIKISFIQIITGVSLIYHGYYEMLIKNIAIYNTDGAIIAGFLVFFMGLIKFSRWIFWNSPKRKELRESELIEINDERNQLIALKATQNAYKRLVLEVFLLIIAITYLKDINGIIYLIVLDTVLSWDRVYKDYYKKLQDEM